jgi:hypothetical protein
VEDVVAGSDLVFPVRRLAPDGLAPPAVAGGGHSAFEVRQTLATLTAPAKEFERLLMAHLLRHTGSPVMRWMAANVIVTMDAAGNIIPSGNKIDGVSAAIVALERALVHAGPERLRGAPAAARGFMSNDSRRRRVCRKHTPSPSARFSESTFSGGRP